MSRYETPTALQHDARTLADDARALLDATAELTDTKVTEARGRLTEALASGKETYSRLQDKVCQAAEVADQTIRSRPYQSLAVAFGLGALIGVLISRRD